MIPRTIHYCWFGDKEKPAEVLRMIANWQKHCPGYEIKEWNENNFDIRLNRYCEEAYATKKWAFVSDVARLWALVHEGGVYMDTDVELVRPLDRLLTNKAFLGFEGTQWVGTNLIGAEPSHSFFIELLKSYDHLQQIIDKIFLSFGKQIQLRLFHYNVGVMRMRNILFKFQNGFQQIIQRIITRFFQGLCCS